MAGDDDRDRVLPERLPDRAAPARLSDAARDVTVGDHLAGGHARGGHEDAALEGGGVAEVEAHVEAPSLAREVGMELVDDVGGARRRAHHVAAEPLPQLGHEGDLALPERDARQPRLGRRHEHAADRGRDGAVIDDTPRRRAGVPVQLPERVERPAIGAELAPALERPEPARQRRRAALSAALVAMRYSQARELASGPSRSKARWARMKASWHASSASWRSPSRRTR